MPEPRSALIAAAQYFYTQGWMVGTAGNLSARLPNGSFWITASGKSKGSLSLEDFVLIQPNGQVKASENLKPSAETAIHQALYTRFPTAQACYHVHSIEANLVSRFREDDRIILPTLEMLKGLGIKAENPHCAIAIFANHLEVSRIATEIEQRFQNDAPQIPALLIRDHGLTVWAASTEEARNFVELMEYIFRYMVIAQQLQIQ